MMNITQEPPRKKTKLHEDLILTLSTYKETIRQTDKPLKVVLNDDVWKPLPLIKVYTGCIKDVKAISKTILLLNEKLPLNSLQHLKRVRKRDVVLCPSECLKDTNIEEYLRNYDEGLLNVFESFKEEYVPQLPPKLKSQYEESKKYWPCNFHPDKYLESLFNGQVFSKDEHNLHILYMQVVFATVKWFYEKQNRILDGFNNDGLKDFNVTVIIDPSINSVVAISTDNRHNHPTQHSAMLAIDNVARTQHGGAWRTDIELDNETFIVKELLQVLKEEFANVKFGHRQFVSKRESNDVIVCNEDSPYLCTGYYVYMLTEPCVMCSMALVHARAKRIFFCFDNKEDGALKSKAKLQTVASLNHNFEVFTGFL